MAMMWSALRAESPVQSLMPAKSLHRRQRSGLHRSVCYIARSAQSAGSGAMIEIQIVPSDIRRSVRYVFFDKRRVLIAIVALSAVLSVVIGSMAAAPTVIRRVYRDTYAKSMREERGIRRERR